MNGSLLAARLTLAIGCFFISASRAPAAAIWTVDVSQSFVRLVIPNQPAKTPDGTPTGNLFITNQASNSGAWSSGNQAAISGTLSTDFANGASIRFRTGESQLMADNSGSYAPDFDNWNSGTSTFNPANAVEPAAFGGQFNTTQTGVLLLVANDLYRFAIRDVMYDLSSGVIPLASNQFSASATAFSMTDAMMGMRGKPANGIPSYFGSADDLQLALSGTNAAATATITSQPGLLTLTLPISVPVTWTVFGNHFTGTAQGTIVATIVPEPDALVLGIVGGSLLIVGAFRRRASLKRN